MYKFAGSFNRKFLLKLLSCGFLSLGLSEDETAALVNVIPVCYAMTYVFGTIGAVQECLGSSVHALGYTITYAVSNTLLILFGIVLVLLLA